ncbi:MAG: recombinase family protein [Cyanobacteria bacterium SZAS LIN-3]|nr:recombinase family protein [Cyanobacteria bacterium SZAS LIN-3]
MSIKLRPVAIGYVRVSGQSQADGESLPAQREAIEEYCKSFGYRLFNVFSDVQSGEDAASREGLQFALSALYANLADYLIVWKLDRFTRKFLDAERLKEEFKARGKHLVTITEEIDFAVSDEGEMAYQVRAAFSEFERKSIKERCQLGVERKRAAGKFWAGCPPFGFMAVGRELVPNENEQAVIRLIFDLRRKGAKISGIALHLNQLGIKTKQGKIWGNSQICNVLTRYQNSAADIVQGGSQPQDFSEVSL